MHAEVPHNRSRIAALSLAALGIVFGDIATSPLYAFRESLHGLIPSAINILGVLSLIFWALVIVISVEYLLFILRADNDGEGGVLALLALLKRQHFKSFGFLLIIGMLGAGLLLGDGMLTPAISVLSAVEGLKIISPAFSKFVVPITFIILFSIFFFQYYGTTRIGKFFGPIIVIWLLTLASLGLYRIAEYPIVLEAINPYYAIMFFVNNGWQGYALLGGVFLVMTGGEALYADLGHFGIKPIRYAWFGLVLPALLLNYFGQGAFLLKHPEAVSDPFYSSAPSWFLYPLLIIATCATIIASQAVITATFSLAKQAILLDIFPRLPVVQTSEHEKGQIYVPQMNFILAVGTLLLILSFKNSSALAHAYGIAVNLVMFGVTVMVMLLARTYWRWSLPKVIALFSLFLFIDLSFLGANLQKFMTGGWAPLLFAAIAATIMFTWHKGLQYMRSTFYTHKIDLSKAIEEIKSLKLKYIPNTTSVFLADYYDRSGGGVIRYATLNRMIPEHILVVTITIENHPYVDDYHRYKVKELHKDFYCVSIHYGFMELIDVPEALRIAKKLKIFPFTFDVEQITYLIEIAHVTATRRYPTLWFHWQEKLFAFLMRNAGPDIEFFKLPYDRTIAIGTYCEI